jgi:hypothetical protein
MTHDLTPGAVNVKDLTHVKKTLDIFYYHQNSIKNIGFQHKKPYSLM